jgi:hypothetical protein
MAKEMDVDNLLVTLGPHAGAADVAAGRYNRPQLAGRPLQQTWLTASIDLHWLAG